MFVYLTFHPESLLAPLVGDVVVAVIFFRLIIFDSSSRTLIDTVYGKYVLFSLLFTSLSLCHWRARNIPSAFDVRVHVLYGYCRIYACVCVCVSACECVYGFLFLRWFISQRIVVVVHWFHSRHSSSMYLTYLKYRNVLSNEPTMTTKQTYFPVYTADIIVLNNELKFLGIWLEVLEHQHGGEFMNNKRIRNRQLENVNENGPI